jgi:hypothetical protein
MTTPMRPLPESVARWIVRRRWLRWADALAMGILLWACAAVVLGSERFAAAAMVAAVLVVAGGAVQELRARWRPVSGWVGLRISAGLRPGDRAWYLRAQEASMVVITACHGVRLVVARVDLQDEGISVRRTRVFVLPVDRP